MHDTLNLCSCGEKPNGPNVIHANIDEEALQDILRYEPSASVMKCCATALPFADASFRHVEAKGVPPDDSVAPGLTREAYRVLAPGGTARMSSAGRNMADLMTMMGFVDVEPVGHWRGTILGMRPGIVYQGRKPG